MPAIASRAITFFITEPMSFIVGEPISEITALTRTGGSAYHALLLSRGGPCKLGLGGDFLRVRAPSPWEGSQLTPSSAPSTATRPPPRFTAHPAAKAGWFQFEHTIRNWAEVGDGRTSPSSKYWTGQPLDPSDIESAATPQQQTSSDEREDPHHHGGHHPCPKNRAIVTCFNKEMVQYMDKVQRQE